MKFVRKKVFICLCVFLVFSSSCSSFRYKEELVEAYYNLGNAYSDLGMLDDSATVFIRALQIDPSFPSAAYNLGIVHIQSGDYKQGIEVLYTLLKNDPENTIIMKILAWGYFKEGDLPHAIEVYESILKIDSYNKDVLNNITILMIHEQMYEEAYQYLVVLESIGDIAGNTLYNLGIAEKELGISSGVERFESAYNTNQTVKEYLVALIDALKAERNYIRVIDFYDVLIAMDPDPELLFNKAFILLTAIEDYDLGIPALEKAIKDGFSDLEKIDELKSFPDLLDEDRILSVLISSSLEFSENSDQSPGIQEEDFPEASEIPD